MARSIKYICTVKILWTNIKAYTESRCTKSKPQFSVYLDVKSNKIGDWITIPDKFTPIPIDKTNVYSFFRATSAGDKKFIVGYLAGSIVANVLSNKVLKTS